MNKSVKELVKLGAIPKDCDMSNELFEEYDDLLSDIKEPLTYEEAERLIGLFSVDCDDLNWTLLHTIETVPFADDIDRYRDFIKKCNNEEFREILNVRLRNYLEKSVP